MSRSVWGGGGPDAASASLPCPAPPPQLPPWPIWARMRSEFSGSAQSLPTAPRSAAGVRLPWTPLPVGAGRSSNRGLGDGHAHHASSAQTTQRLSVTDTRSHDPPHPRRATHGLGRRVHGTPQTLGAGGPGSRSRMWQVAWPAPEAGGDPAPGDKQAPCPVPTFRGGAGGPHARHHSQGGLQVGPSDPIPADVRAARDAGLRSS